MKTKYQPDQKIYFQQNSKFIRGAISVVVTYESIHAIIYKYELYGMEGKLFRHNELWTDKPIGQFT